VSVGFQAGEKGNIFYVTECLQSMCRPGTNIRGLLNYAITIILNQTF